MIATTTNVLNYIIKKYKDAKMETLQEKVTFGLQVIENYDFYCIYNCRPRTYHAVFGPVSLTAYNSQTSNRGMYSVCVSTAGMLPVVVPPCSPVITGATAVVSGEPVNNNVVFFGDGLHLPTVGKHGHYQCRQGGVCAWQKQKIKQIEE